MGARGLRTAARLLAVLALTACGPRPAPPVRIVLITLDTLRFDRFADEPGRTSRMPRTRAFAERGLRFESFWSASSATQPTHASLFTGLHPWEHGVPRNGATLAEEHRTLAERLRDAGFTTAAVVASFPLEPRFGFAQGFDVFRHEFDQVLLPAWEGAAVADGRFYSLAGSVTQRALAALDAATGERQFFFFHYFDPHDPYGDSGAHSLPLARLLALQTLEPAALEAGLEQARRLYDRDVAALDRALGVLLDRIVIDSARFETHVLITADHGESFGELGAIGHGRRVTRAQVQVLLVVVSPRVAPGIRRDTAGTVDLTATVLNLAGVVDAALPGRDLTLPAAPADGGAVGMIGRPAVALDPARGVALRERFFTVRAGALYSGDAHASFEEDDPGRHVLDATLDASLRQLFRGFEASLSGQVVKQRRDRETEEGLRALGYVE
jgi:membrane-anchored protein YejM (alkaline phosphatase superfamily)